MNLHQEMSGKDASESQLSALLDESWENALRRERSAFDSAAQPFAERLVLFGAGGLGRRVRRKLADIGLTPLAFTDNNPALWGTSIDGVRVYSPSAAAEQFGQNAAFLVAIWNSHAKDRMSQRKQQLVNLGCRVVLPATLLFWKYSETFLPYFSLDLPHKALQSAREIKAGFELFRDEASRREYVAQVAFRLRLDYEGMAMPEDDGHYFPPDILNLTTDEMFVDCGAFDGDSVAEFIRRLGESFSAIIAFEPDPLNWEKLRRRVQEFPNTIQRKILALPQALGSRRQTIIFNATGTDQSKAGTGSITVECVTLDEALRDLAPTLIKFDIEGAELEALEGAREVIARCRPVLAVSAYHEQNHLWRVPLTLQQLCRDYDLFLRPGGSEGWDLVCYAIPWERLKKR